MKTPYRLKPYNDSTRPHLKYVVNFKEKDAASGVTKRARRFFETKTEAKTFVEKQSIQHLNQGTEAAEFPTWLRVMAQKANDLLKPFGKSILQAAEHYATFLETSSKSAMVSVVVDEFLAGTGKTKKTRSGRYRKDLANRLGHFAKEFGARLISTLTYEEVDSWLGRVAKGRNRNNTRRVLIVLFNFAVWKKYAPDNVVKLTSKDEEGDEAPGILSVEQTSNLLNAAPFDLIPYFAIGAFAGLRPSELERLEWSSINFEEGHLEVKGRKGGRQRGAKIRFVKILPNLAKWLAPYAASVGPVAPKENLRKRIEATRRAAKIMEWPHDALRHGFASYHLAEFKDKNALILEMGHTGDEMIFNHYRASVTSSVAKKYWAITPKASHGKIVPMLPAPEVAPIAEESASVAVAAN